MRAAALLLTSILLPSLSHAAPPTVAVLPFADLGGGPGRVGEALRETITVDLADGKAVRVVERARLDQVIAESELGAKKATLDALGSVRVGTLVGATLIVTGAYQRSGDTVRLTARLIEVATGEVLGGAKVDGKAVAVLQLADQLTSQLLVAGKLKPPPRPRPHFLVKSWRTMEVYADAVVEPDAGRKRQLLEQLLKEDPQFIYARRDLDALQARMQGYAATASVQLSERERAALQQLRGKLSSSEREQKERALYGEMIAARRFFALESAAQTLGGAQPSSEALYALFVARDRLHRFDLALQNGEAYLKAFPTGAHFGAVEARLHAIAETKKKRLARRAEYDADLKDKLAGLAPGLERDHAPCIVARWNNQQNQLMLDACTTFVEKWQGRAPADEASKVTAARFFIILALAEQGDFARARPLAERLIADSDDWDEELRQLMSEWPSDGPR